MSRRYNLTATSNWKLESMLVTLSYVEMTLGDHCGHELSLVDGPLRTKMEYLQNASKRIQRQFYNRWIANHQS